MKYLVLAFCICAANGASLGAYNTPYKPQRQVAQAVAQVIQDPVVVAEAPVVAARTVVPVVTPKNVVPVVTPKTVVPVVAQRTIVPVAKNINQDESHAAIVRLDAEVAADGYNFAYETENGISAQSSGSLRKVDETDVLAIQGSYQYVAPDGTPVRFVYVADENGYHPESDLLPVGPPIPDAILRSLEYIRAHPPKPEQY